MELITLNFVPLLFAGLLLFLLTGFPVAFSLAAPGLTFGLIGMLSSISIMSSGFVADRFGYRRTVTASFAGTATGMLLLMAITAWPSTLLLALFVPVFGLCMGPRGPIVSSICARHFAGPNVATIYGTIYSANALGAATGSFIGGLLHDLTGGYVPGLCFSLVFIALAAMPFWTVPALKHYR